MAPLVLSLALCCAASAASAQGGKGAARAEGPNAARAAPAGALPSGYEAAIDQALSEYELRNWDEARALFVRAHEIYPNARSLRGLGMVEFERRNYGESIRHLEDALNNSVRPLDAELRSETEQLLERAKGFVGRLSIEVNPGMATVLVDGVPVELSKGRSLTLQVGDHTIEVLAEKYKPEKRQLSVNGGEDQKLAIVLKQDLPPPFARKDESKPLYKNPWLWTGVSVLVIGASVGAAFLFHPEAEKRVEPVTTANTPDGAILQGLASW